MASAIRRAAAVEKAAKEAQKKREQEQQKQKVQQTTTQKQTSSPLKGSSAPVGNSAIRKAAATEKAAKAAMRQETNRQQAITTSKNYLETARNATQKRANGANADEIQNSIDSLKTARQKYIDYGNKYGTTANHRKTVAEIDEKLNKLTQEYEAATAGTSYIDDLNRQLAEAQEKERRAANAYGQFMSEARSRSMGMPEATANQLKTLQAAAHQAREEREAVEKELEQIEYLNKYSAKQYTETGDKWDDFWSQGKANYNLGRIGQDKSKAFAEYADDPTEANKDYALALKMLEEDFAQRNAEVLDDEGAVLPWVSQNAASYIPQAIDQGKGMAIGGGIGALAGSAVGMPLVGAKWGASIGSGVSMYDVVRGAAIESMVDAGIDLNTATQASQDEAVLSALIEMAETGVDFATFGATGWFRFLGNYGVNIGSEGLEEGLQQGVSIANRRRIEAGEDPSLLGLAWDTVKTYGNALIGRDDEARSEMWDAAKEGSKTAAVIGGVQRVGNEVVSRAVNGRDMSAVDPRNEYIAEAQTPAPADKTAMASAAQPAVANAVLEQTQAENDPVAQFAREAVAEETNMPELATESRSDGISSEGVKLVENETKTAQAKPQQTDLTHQQIAAEVARERYGYDQHGAETFAKMLGEDGDMDSLNAHVKTAYEVGLTDAPMKGTDFSSKLQIAAYNAGRMDAAANLEAFKKQGATIWGKEGGLVHDSNDNYKKLSKRKAQSLDLFGKAVGVKIIVDSNVSANGEYENGVARVSPTAQNPVMVVAKHEVTHHLQKAAPEAYVKFRSYAIQQLNSGLMDGDVTMTERQRMKYLALSNGEVNLTTEEAMDEVVSNFTEYLLSDERAMDKFIRDVTGVDNRSWAQKFFDAVHDFVAKLTNGSKKYRSLLDEVMREEYGLTLQQFETIEQKWKDAIKEANANAKKPKQIEQKDATKSDARYSLKDSEGNTLSEAQAEYFKDSKVRDENGRLLVMYHGTPNASFTEFHSSSYFTQNKEYAKNYVHVAASSNGVKKNNSNPDVYEVYLNITKPFDTRNPKERKIFENEFYRKWGNGAPLAESGLPDWTDGDDLQEFIEENEYDYDGLILDEGGTGGYGDEVKSRGLSYVIFHPEQVKNVDNKNPTDNPDIRFSLKEPREETKNLIALHNLTEQNLLDSLKIGGFPIPSIAVVKAKHGHSKYGPISLIFGKDTIDPQTDKRNKVYGGDAYTPTVPSVEYPVNYERVRAVEQEIEKLSQQVADGIFSHSSVLRSRGIEDESNMNADELAKRLAGVEAVQAAYLADKGEQLTPVLKDKVFDSYGNKALQDYIDNAGYQEVARLVVKVETGERLTADELETARDTIMKHWVETHEYSLRNKPELRDMRIAKQREKISDLRAEDFILHAWEMYEDGGATKGDIDRTATAEAMTNRLFEMSDGEGFDAIDRMIEPWIRAKLDGVLGEAGIYNGQDRFTRSGNRKSFEQLHYSYTLENIVKAMTETQPERGGQTWGITAGTLQATASKTYKSIADIKKDSDRLGAVEGEEYTTRVQAVENEIKEVIQQVRKNNKPHADNTFEEEEIIGSVLMDAAQTKKTINAITQTFSKEGYTISNQTAKNIQTLYKNAAALPTEYFEAKPQRAVGFDEVLTAVLPDNVDSKLISSLEENGVPVMTYKSGDEADRLKKVNAVENARFSLKEDKDILKENAKLKEINAALKNQFKVTKFTKVDKKSLDTFAKQLLKDYESGADINETRIMLDGLYQYMANGENGESAIWEEAYQQAREIAEDVLTKAVTLDDTMYQQYKSLRDYLRKTGIYVDKSYSSDLWGYEDLNDFRKRNFGRIKLTNDGIPLDSFYQQLAGMYPEFFDAESETNPADQLVRIAEVLDELQPTEFNPHSADMSRNVTMLANDIMERFFDLPQAKPTFADKAERKLVEARIHEGKKLENLRAKKNERIEQLIAEGRQKVKETQQKEREKRVQAVENIKEHYQEKETKMSDRRKAAVLRKRIEDHVKTLSAKLLHPTDKQHVPEELRGVVDKLLENINLESQYTIDEATGKRVKNGNGKPTRRSQIFGELHKQYIELAKNGNLVIDPSLLGDAETQGLFTKAIALGDIKIVDMTVQELDILWQTIRAVERSITMANRTLASTKAATISDWATDIEEETDTRKAMKGRGTEKLRLDLENPYTFFSHYGESGKAIFRMLRNAQDKQQMMTNHIAEEVAKVVDDKTVKKLEKDTHEFKTERGDKLTLTTAHVMEVYLLSKREQAQGHLLKGGIVQPAIESKKIKRGTDSILLSFDDLQNIIGKLTQEQRDIADVLQKLTSTTLAEYGNEASMKAYGYKKFTGENYWTIKSAKEGIHSNIEKGAGNSRSIKNIGLAKNVMPHASNPLDINGIFKTFASHSADMIDYSAWLCPMEDANRLYNYSFRDDMGNQTGKTMKGLLDRVGGIGAQEYWHNLMEDIQNGIKTRNDTIFAKAVDKLVGNAKAASVGANIRVIIQQPTAIMKAAMVLSPADMAKGALSGGGWKTALKHSAIAQRKDTGGFDISSPVQMYETLFDGRTAGRKFNDAMMWGAGKADAITWGRIWNACEHNVKHNQPNLQKGSKEFYKAVDALFTEVVDQSQVVDGILQRAQVMRSSNAVVKQMTSFMGEPIMAMNMLIRSYDAWRNQTDKQKRNVALKKLSRATTVLVATNAVNALAQSIVDAWRDDDEDKDYMERLWTALFGITGEEETVWDKATAAILEGNLGSSMNPLTYIPMAKDVISLISGYDVTRMDADVLSDLLKAGTKLKDSMTTDGKYTKAYGIKEFALNVTKACGISAMNILRDVWGIMRSFAVATDNVMAQYQMEKAILKVGSEKNNSAFVDILWRAYNTDQETYEAIYNDMIDNGIDAEKIASKMETHMMKAEGVEKTKDLKERYLSPNNKRIYDSKMSTITNSKLWKNASAEQRKDTQTDVYNLVSQNDRGETLKEKIDEGASYGMSETDYILYQLATEMCDTPNKNSKLGGSPTNAEKAAAIEAVGGLSDGVIAYLWDTKDGYEAYANGIDMQKYVEYVGSGHSVNVEKLTEAQDYGMSEDDYFDFLDMLKEVDQPTKSGKYGSYTQDEATAAIDALDGLTREQKAWLWQSVNKSWKTNKNPWR